jgi:o-succinylbenzoate synthase
MRGKATSFSEKGGTMKIERVDLILVEIPLVHHFETSYGRMRAIEKLIVKTYTRDLVAYSECVVEPGLGYTAETPETARVVLTRYLLPRVLGQELDGPEDYWKRVGGLRGHPMTKAALDNAIWMLKAMGEGKSLATATGADKERVFSGGVSVGIQDSLQEFEKVVEERIGRGARRIKLKIKPGWDVGPLETFRRRWPDLEVMVDANNGYDYHRHRDFLTAIDRFNLLMFEQPLAMEDLYYHARLQSEIKTPICLDESIHSPYHAEVAAAMGACRIINIKQARCGGLTPARQVHDIATRHGIGCWCGGMIETGIGMTLNTAVAAWPNMVYPSAIYANRNFLVEDIIDPPTVVAPDGTVAVPQAPGLGVNVKEDVLDRFTKARDVIRA